MQYLCNGWTDNDESFTPNVKSPVDSKYDVRIDDPHIQSFSISCSKIYRKYKGNYQKHVDRYIVTYHFRRVAHG